MNARQERKSLSIFSLNFSKKKARVVALCEAKNLNGTVGNRTCLCIWKLQYLLCSESKLSIAWANPGVGGHLVPPEGGGGGSVHRGGRRYLK